MVDINKIKIFLVENIKWVNGYWINWEFVSLIVSKWWTDLSQPDLKSLLKIF